MLNEGTNKTLGSKNQLGDREETTHAAHHICHICHKIVEWL